jgi:Ca2+-binding RTX toxin-like protein
MIPLMAALAMTVCWAGVDTLLGGIGNDTLVAGEGDFQYLIGGDDADSLQGGNVETLSGKTAEWNKILP